MVRNVRMTLLLYFTSYASLVVLLVSATVVGAWTLLKLIRAVVRIYRLMTDPELRAERRRQRAYDPQLHLLKRAGQ